MAILHLVSVYTLKIKEPIAFGGTAPQTPCFRYPLLCLAPPLMKSWIRP